MAYTPPVRKAKSSTQPNNFAGVKTDSNRVAMMGPTGNIIQTQDQTGTPVTSPVTVNTTKTLVVPDGAVSCTITSVTNAVQISEDSTQTAYFSLPAAQVLTFDCADMANIYLKTGSSTVVSFLFKIV
jgi:hypothetical protein